MPGVTYYLVLELEDVVAGTTQPETYIEGSTSDVYSNGSLTQGETGDLVDAWFSVLTVDSTPPPSPFPVSSTVLYEYTDSFSHAWSGTTIAFEPATPGTLGSFSHLGFTNNLSAPLSFQLYSQHPVTNVLISKDCVTDSKTAGEWGYTTDHPVHSDVDITHIGPFTGTECGMSLGTLYRIKSNREDTVAFFGAADSKAWLRVFAAATTESVADLALSITDTPDPVVVGQNLTYRFTVHDNGPDAATNAAVSITLPDNVTPVTIPPNCTGVALILRPQCTVRLGNSTTFSGITTVRL